MPDRPDLQARLSASLLEAAAALQAGDLEAASLAIERVVASCEACTAAKVVLPPKDLQAAQGLFERCNTLAATAQKDLHARLMAAGASGRARKGYDSSS